MPFWDWTLDWQDVRKAPVWGEGLLDFGTNGRPGALSNESVLDDGCVVDGAFSRMILLHLNGSRIPHCLSRGFLDGEILDAFQQQIRPEAIEQLLAETTYDVFSFIFEQTTHLAIPNIVHGDIAFITGPNGELLPSKIYGLPESQLLESRM